MHYYSFYFSIITYIRFQNFFSSNYFCKLHSLKGLKGLANFTAPFTHMKKLQFQVTLHYTQVLPKALSVLHSFYNPACQKYWQTYDHTVPSFAYYSSPSHNTICQKHFHIKDKNLHHYYSIETHIKIICDSLTIFNSP